MDQNRENRRRDRPRYNFDNDPYYNQPQPNDSQYSQYNPYHPEPDPRTRNRDRHQFEGGQWNGEQGGPGWGADQQQPRYEPPRPPPLQPPQQEQPPPPQAPRRTIEYSPIMEGEYRSFIEQLVQSTLRCNDFESRIDELVNVKNEMLSPVFEDFCNNLRRMDAYHSDAQTTYFLYKNQVQTFNCIVNNIDYFCRHGFVPTRQIKFDLEDKGIIIERRKSAQQEYMGKLEGLLAGARIVIDNTWANFNKERESQMPRTSQSLQGTVVIEEIDEKSGVCVEHEKPPHYTSCHNARVVVATDEVSELKQEMMKMQLQMDQILEILQKPQNVVVMAQTVAPVETKAPALEAMDLPTQVVELKQERGADEHRSENGRGRRDQKNGHHESSRTSEHSRQDSSRNGPNQRGWYYEDENSGELKKDDNGNRFENMRYDDRSRRNDQDNGQNSHASESNRGEPSQNGEHYGGRSYEFEDQVEMERNDHGNRFESMRHPEEPRRSDQDNEQSSHDQRYDSDLPRTNEDDHRDYRRDDRRYQNDNFRGGPSNYDARRSESPHYYNRAHDEPDFSDHDQSQSRSSRSRNGRGNLSPARSHQSRNRYDSYDNGRGQNMDYDNHRYSGPNHPNEHQGGYSRESSRARGYSPQYQSSFHSHDEIDGINYARPPSNMGPGPSKQQQNPRPQGAKKQKKGSANGNCYYCKQPGHQRNHCPKFRCSICDAYGHKEVACPSKKFN